MTNLLDERIDHHQSMDWTYGQNRGIVEGLALDRFAGPDGLMLLLSILLNVNSQRKN